MFVLQNYFKDCIVYDTIANINYKLNIDDLQILKNLGIYIYNPKDINNIYILTEDKSSGYEFWSWLCKYKLINATVITPEEKKGWNNYKIVEKVRSIKYDNNIYIILFDESFDNPQTIEYQRVLQNICNSKYNVFLIKNFYGLESIFLTFENLIDWLEKNKTLTDIEVELIKHFNNSLRNHINPLKNEDIKLKLKNLLNKNAKINNSEEACASLINKITEKSKGFNVRKNKIGNCWIKDCCYNKYIDCGLKLDKESKADVLYRKTYIEELFKESRVTDVTDLC